MWCLHQRQNGQTTSNETKTFKNIGSTAASTINTHTYTHYIRQASNAQLKLLHSTINFVETFSKASNEHITIAPPHCKSAQSYFPEPSYKLSWYAAHVNWNAYKALMLFRLWCLFVYSFVFLLFVIHQWTQRHWSAQSRGVNQVNK